MKYKWKVSVQINFFGTKNYVDKMWHLQISVNPVLSVELYITIIISELSIWYKCDSLIFHLTDKHDTKLLF